MNAMRYKYRLVQGGITVATVETTDKAQAEKEINHYAMMYVADGPVKIIRRQKQEAKP